MLILETLVCSYRFLIKSFHLFFLLPVYILTPDLSIYLAGFFGYFLEFFLIYVLKDGFLGFRVQFR